MIIDDDHAFAFLHIPKCAGTAVRRQLESIDSFQGYFHNRRHHDRLGVIDFGHIPLAFLASDFPDAFDKIGRYETFVLVREPHARFASATFQRLHDFRGIVQTAATAEVAIREAEFMIEWLEARGPFCDDGYIHFARQIDYVALDGRQIVRNIYALEDMERFGEAIRRTTGAKFDALRRENTNFASTSRVVAMLRNIKPLYSRFTSWRQREQILLFLRRWKLQAPDALYSKFRNNKKISDFVESYYAADFDLYEAAAARAKAASERQQTVPAGVATVRP
jgi:hypothetical protein